MCLLGCRVWSSCSSLFNHHWYAHIIQSRNKTESHQIKELISCQTVRIYLVDICWLATTAAKAARQCEVENGCSPSERWQTGCEWCCQLAPGRLHSPPLLVFPARRSQTWKKWKKTHINWLVWYFFHTEAVGKIELFPLSSCCFFAVRPCRQLFMSSGRCCCTSYVQVQNSLVGIELLI